MHKINKYLRLVFGFYLTAIESLTEGSSHKLLNKFQPTKYHAMPMYIHMDVLESIFTLIELISKIYYPINNSLA